MSLIQSSAEACANSLKNSKHMITLGESFGLSCLKLNLVLKDARELKRSCMLKDFTGFYVFFFFFKVKWHPTQIQVQI